MATPTEFPEQSRALGPPPGWTTDECGDLPVADTFDRDSGRHSFVSCWRLSWRERLAALFTGRVWLGVVGDAHPPVWISGQHPGFERPDPGEQPTGPIPPGPPDPPPAPRRLPVG